MVSGTPNAHLLSLSLPARLLVQSGQLIETILTDPEDL